MPLIQSFLQFLTQRLHEAASASIAEVMPPNITVFQSSFDDSRGKRTETTFVYRNPTTNNFDRGGWTMPMDPDTRFTHMAAYLTATDLYLWDRAKGTHKGAVRALNADYPGMKNDPTLWPIYIKVLSGGRVHVATAPYEDHSAPEMKVKGLATRYQILRQHPELSGAKFDSEFPGGVLWTPGDGQHLINTHKIQGMDWDARGHENKEAVIVRGPGKQSDDKLIASQAI